VGCGGKKFGLEKYVQKKGIVKLPVGGGKKKKGQKKERGAGKRAERHNFGGQEDSCKKKQKGRNGREKEGRQKSETPRKVINFTVKKLGSSSHRNCSQRTKGVVSWGVGRNQGRRSSKIWKKKKEGKHSKSGVEKNTNCERG